MASGIKASAFYSKKDKDVRICFPSNPHFSDDGDSDSDPDEGAPQRKYISDKVIPPSYSEHSSSSENDSKPPKELVKRRKKITPHPTVDRYSSSQTGKNVTRRCLFTDVTNTRTSKHIVLSQRKPVPGNENIETQIKKQSLT
ncbi:uncharacterized protein LOC117647753 [Thrips palmi]|uniref:Uncharacterized protein LOC117647753 n=1 Tax=Thrips palmi TaxID=161013 RepID=A0A6P8Z6G5_THRPL|nr:uncharacterized protein LOC117647753 [Thrips palmi]